MRLFHCTHCGSLVFFDSSECLGCGSTLAFDPDRLEMVAMQPAADLAGMWQRLDTQAAAPTETTTVSLDEAPLYQLCSNREAHNACNFSVPYVPVENDEPVTPHLCVSCQQTRVLPDLSDVNNVRRWTDIETAKRRLYYSLAQLNIAQIEGEPGPVYEFKADTPEAPVMTGHDEGVITLNVAEADDDERTRRRVELGEPYRTLLGHLRHESGHYFWDVLVLRGGHVDAYRAVFGDERADYGEALKAHYASAPHTGWQNEFISDYATSHPWEDWAETWAHYLHMVDLLETAQSYRTEVSIPSPQGEPRYSMVNPFGEPAPDFDAMLAAWVPQTLLLNSLNRSLGQLDAYPFAMGAGVKEKLRFVHALVNRQLTPVPWQPEQAPSVDAAPVVGDASLPVDAPAAGDVIDVPAQTAPTEPVPMNDGSLNAPPLDAPADAPLQPVAEQLPEPELQK